MPTGGGADEDLIFCICLAEPVQGEGVGVADPRAVAAAMVDKPASRALAPEVVAEQHVHREAQHGQRPSRSAAPRSLGQRPWLNALLILASPNAGHQFGAGAVERRRPDALRLSGVGS